MAIVWYRIPPETVGFPPQSPFGRPWCQSKTRRSLMRKLLGLSLALAVVSCAQDRSAPPTAPEPAATASQGLTLSADGDYVAGQILVRFRPSAPTSALLAPHGASIRREVLAGVKVLNVPPGAEL